MNICDPEDYKAVQNIDYTKWRQSQPWVNMPLDEAMDNAMNYVKNNPGVIPKNATLI
jgi:hypothetical protein